MGEHKLQKHLSNLLTNYYRIVRHRLQDQSHPSFYLWLLLFTVSQKTCQL